MMALSSDDCAWFMHVDRKGSIKESHRSGGENPFFSTERIHAHSRGPTQKLHLSRSRAIKIDVGLGPHPTIACATSGSLF